MRPAAPMRSQSPFHDRAQLAGGRNWTAPAGFDNHPRDSSRAALLAVRIDDAREFLGALFIYNVFRLQRLPVVHPHIEGTVEPERKPALRIVERVAAHAEVGKDRVGALEMMPPHDVGNLAEVRALEHDAIAEFHQ